MTTNQNIKEFLDNAVQSINTKEFIPEDPVQFPRRFKQTQDIEITAFLSATIAWGNRSMILRNCNKMLSLMKNEPYRYVMESDFTNLGTKNIHRTFFESDLAWYLRGFKELYSKYDTIENAITELLIKDSEMPYPIAVLNILTKYCEIANPTKPYNQYCLPSKNAHSALKKINLALRWLVRDDGIVDIGIWRSLSKAKLYIPLDTHVIATSKKLNLLNRKSNDFKAVEELTANLRAFNPEDPTIYDFALFGFGVKGYPIPENL